MGGHKHPCLLYAISLYNHRMKQHIRVIGDIHCNLDGGENNEYGKERSYFTLIEDAEYSVQIGDFGFPIPPNNPSFHDKVATVDKTRHVAVLGNHDDYNQRIANELGDFGVHSFPLENGKFEFFYMRGAFTPDFYRRIIGIDLWREEQLTDQEGWDVVKLYQKIKPSIVITHDCPEVCLYMFYGGNCKVDRTNRILQTCFEIHQPKLWIFGHHHRNWKYTYKDTLFICLDGRVPHLGHVTGFLDFDNNGNIVGGTV